MRRRVCKTRFGGFNSPLHLVGASSLKTEHVSCNPGVAGARASLKNLRTRFDSEGLHLVLWKLLQVAMLPALLKRQGGYTSFGRVRLPQLPFTMNTKSAGSIVEAHIMTVLLKRGDRVCLPFGENCPYDLIFDRDNRLGRVQCRKARYKNGSLEFDLSRVFYDATQSKVVKRPCNKKEIDYFGIYCQEIGKAYLIPIEDIKAKIQFRLRIDPLPSNVSPKSVNWAKPYEL